MYPIYYVISILEYPGLKALRTFFFFFFTKGGGRFSSEGFQIEFRDGRRLVGGGGIL